jgi:hypothetical protein
MLRLIACVALVLVATLGDRIASNIAPLAELLG